MKNKILLSTVLAASLCHADMSDFLDDHISSTVEDPGYYQSQTRGLYTLGAGKFRFNKLDEFSPVHVDMPKLSMGCSGIDMVFGGFSYLDAEFLVSKLKAIASAAPAFAFQIALANLCEDCVTRMNELEAIANAINNFSMDTCKASQRIGTFAANQVMGQINANMNTGQSNNFITAQESAKSDSDGTLRDYINTVGYYLGSNDLAKEKIDKVAIQGSLLEEAVLKGNSSWLDQDLLGKDLHGGPLTLSLLRTMTGDIIGYRAKVSNSSDKEPGNGDGTYKFTITESYPLDLDAFIHGGDIDYVFVDTQDDNYGKPEVVEGRIRFSGIMPIFQTRIESFVSSLQAKTAPSESDRDFINSMPIPIAKFLNTAVLSNSNTDNLAQYLAILETQAFLSNIIQTAGRILNYEQIKNSSDQDEEVKEFVKDVIVNTREFQRDLDQWQITALKKWDQKRKITDYWRELEQRLKSKLAGSNTYNSLGI